MTNTKKKHQNVKSRITEGTETQKDEVETKWQLKTSGLQGCCIVYLFELLYTDAPHVIASHT